MICRVALAVFTIVLTPVAAKARSESCVDAVVIARILKQSPTELPQESEAIIMHWPWVVDLEVEQTVFGREQPRDLHVSMSLHSGLNDEIRYGLFFLKRGESGGYGVVDFDYEVVVDARDRFVRPMPDPLEPKSEGDWIPEDYEAWLRPIRYRGADAWWLEPRPDPNPDEPVVAKRGLVLAEMPRLLKAAGRELCRS